MKHQHLKAFFGNLGYRLQLLDETRAETDVFLSSRFNIFDYIDPDENRLSDIVRDLLDPKGAHGQKDRFLRKFLELLCNRNDFDGRCRTLRREDLTALIKSDRRRMDIFIDFDEFAVAIENKPWAREQREQIADYVGHLRRRYDENFIIVFLSGAGEEPRSLEERHRRTLIDNGQLVCASYPGKFKEWLQSCVKECESDRVRSFLRDFIGFVEQEFSTTPLGI